MYQTSKEVLQKSVRALVFKPKKRTQKAKGSSIKNSRRLRSAILIGNGNTGQKIACQSHKRIKSERKIPPNMSKAQEDNFQRDLKRSKVLRQNSWFQENLISKENQKKKISIKALPWPDHLIEKIAVPYLSKENLYKEKEPTRETMSL